jgi:hypothetical protein
MGFRSRALLTGVATGFLKATNDRRDKMAERMQMLADNKALMDRERAKSRADAAAKEAAAEAAKWSELRSVEHIDDEGNYTDKYHDTVAAAKFAEEGVRKAFGNDFEKFKAEWRKMGPSKFTRQYKDPNEIESSLQKVYGSIEARQQAELSRPVLTGFDAMLGSMVNRVSSAVGGKPVFGSDPQETPEMAELETMTGAQQEPMSNYESPKFAPVVEQEKPETVNQIVTDETTGERFAVFADSNGKLRETKLNIKAKVGDDSKGFGKLGTDKVRLYNPATKTFFKEETHQDIESGTIRIGNEWVDVPEGLIAAPADVKLVDINFPDPNTGEEMTAQAYRAITGEMGENIITLPDGTAWSTVSKPIKRFGAQDQHSTTKKIPAIIKTNLEEFNRQHKAIVLTDSMLGLDFVSNPVSWAQKNLSVLTDSVAAAAGFTGSDRAGDLDAIVDFINKEVSAAGMTEKIGRLDAEAVKAGEKKAIQSMLKFALADAQKGGDRLSVQDVEQAASVVEPTIFGSEAHRGALVAVRKQAEKRVATVVDQDITTALGQGPESEIWDYYPSSRVQVNKGLTPLTSVFDGRSLANKIEALETTNPTAYEQTIKYLTANKSLGTKWKDILNSPVRVDRETGTVFLPFYKESSDGTIRIGIYKAK